MCLDPSVGFVLVNARGPSLGPLHGGFFLPTLLQMLSGFKNRQSD